MRRFTKILDWSDTFHGGGPLSRFTRVQFYRLNSPPRRLYNVPRSVVSIEIESMFQPAKSSRRCLARLFVFLLLVILVAPVLAQETPAQHSKEFSATDISAANSLVQNLGVADWLGPLAPVALSPFFGIACLSGMALYGQGWVSTENAFLGVNSPLSSSMVFWTFLILTLVTSVPRFTKVSKPFAQAVDQVEAWAGIITLLALKLMMGASPPEPDQVVMLQAGIGSVTVDGLLMIAAAVNIVVINTVKFFFEVLIWITPIPTIDAAFEVANKSICAVLMAIYGCSPVLATGINLTMFVLAALIFHWAYRREVFYRVILVDAVWQWFSPPKQTSPDLLTVFPTDSLESIPARSKCQLSRTDNGWLLTHSSLLGGKTQVPIESSSMELDAGYFTNSLKIQGRVNCELSFSRWYNAALPQLADALGARLNEQDAAALKNHAGLKAELA